MVIKHLRVVCTSQVGGTALFPGAGFFELAAASQRLTLTSENHNSAAVVEATISAPLRLAAAPKAFVMLCCELNVATGDCVATSRACADTRATVHMTANSHQTAQHCCVKGRSLNVRPTKRLAWQLIASCAFLATATGGQGESVPQRALAKVGQPVNRKADGYCVHPGPLDSALQLGQLCLGHHDGVEGALPRTPNCMHADRGPFCWPALVMHLSCINMHSANLHVRRHLCA